MPMNEPKREPADPPQIDRGVLASLLREIQATHLFVWKANAGGVLVSVRIPLDEIAEKIRLAGRIAEQNLGQATTMIQAASQQFDAAAQRWEVQARQSEERLRAERAPKRLSDATARHNTIRVRIAPLQNLFRRAVQSLEAAQRRRQPPTE
jgi:hypothetical protein